MNTTWKIALGVVLGLMMFCGIGLTGLLILGATIDQPQPHKPRPMIAPSPQELGMEAINGIADQLNNTSFPQRLRREVEADRIQKENAAKAQELAPNERCLNGARLANVDGQWIQTGKCH